MNNQSKTQSQTARRSRDNAPAADAKRVQADDIINYVRELASERPELVALWCFGAGVVFGWKLRRLVPFV